MEKTMDDKINVEQTEYAVRQIPKQETAFVNLLNQEMENLLRNAGYRKESDTAREILQAVDNESNGQTVAVTNVLRKRYGVELTEDKE